MRTWILGGVALGLAGSIALAAAYRSDLRGDRARVEGRSIVLTSPYGETEYLEGGVGPAVLLIHGAGGGYDQGELMAEVLLGDGFRWLAPSRFGYLRSALPEGATAEDQADAFAWLLDELGIERVAVVALSAGGPAGLLFALLHPDRVSSLTLVAAGVTSLSGEDQAAADWKGRVLARLVARDFPYWAVTKLFERRFIELMGADREVVAGLSSEERAHVRRVIETMRPASARSPGVMFDHTADFPGDRIAGIRVPTLVVHAEDDQLQLFEHARFAEATIPGARLLRFERGGHLVMIIEQPVIRRAVRRHILEHTEDG